MNDIITMKLNADPLILSALKEYNSCDDDTTQPVLPNARPSEADFPDLQKSEKSTSRSRKIRP